MEPESAVGTRETTNKCHICARIADFVEIDNPQDPSEKEVFDDFAEEVKELVPPNPSLERYYQFQAERLLKCPSCGTYYLYRRWAPGGSEDVMRTYIHESVRRVGFLAAHKELHAAFYKSSQRAKEYGGHFQAIHDEIAGGVHAELMHLRHRYREIVSEAIACLEDKYEYSRQLSELADRFLPHTGQQQVAEARQREERVAEYHAEILVEYLQCYPDEEVESGIARRLSRLLADNNQQVRRIILDGLLQTLSRAEKQQTLAEVLVDELEKQESLYAEAHELLAVCRGGV